MLDESADSLRVGERRVVPRALVGGVDVAGRGRSGGCGCSET